MRDRNPGTRTICATKVSESELMIAFPVIGMQAGAKTHNHALCAETMAFIQEASLDPRIFRRMSLRGQGVAQSISR